MFLPTACLQIMIRATAKSGQMGKVAANLFHCNSTTKKADEEMEVVAPEDVIDAEGFLVLIQRHLGVTHVTDGLNLNELWNYTLYNKNNDLKGVP